MLFNSFTFLIFLPIVFILYWFVFQKNLKLQNAFLLLASYVFYGWWDWRFLGLIIASSAVDYYCGLKLGPRGTVIARRNDEAISSLGKNQSAENQNRLLQIDSDSNNSESADNLRNDAYDTGQRTKPTTNNQQLTTNNQQLTTCPPLPKA